MTTVAQEDLSRPIWPACPSHGWKTGVHKLTSLPIKGGNLSVIPGGRRRTHRRLLRKHVGMTPVDPGPKSPVSDIELQREYHIEYHGPYLQGSGFPAVNGEQYTTITSNQLEDIRSDRTKRTSYGAGKAPLSLAPTAIPLQVQRTTNVIGPQYQNVGCIYASITPASTCNGFKAALC